MHSLIHITFIGITLPGVMLCLRFFWEEKFSLKSLKPPSCWRRVCWVLLAGRVEKERERNSWTRWGAGCRHQLLFFSSRISEPQEEKLVAGGLENCQVEGTWGWNTAGLQQMVEELFPGYSAPRGLHDRFGKIKSRAACNFKRWENLRMNQDMFSIIIL